jgi:hypothetical protein
MNIGLRPRICAQRCHASALALSRDRFSPGRSLALRVQDANLRP